MSSITVVLCVSLALVWIMAMILTAGDRIQTASSTKNNVPKEQEMRAVNDVSKKRARVHYATSRLGVSAAAWQNADEEQATGIGLTKRLHNEVVRLDSMKNFLLDFEDLEPADLCNGCELIFVKGARSVLAWKVSIYIKELEPLQSDMLKRLANDEEVTAEEVYRVRYGPARQAFLSSLEPRELFWLGINGYLDRRTPCKGLTENILIRQPNGEMKPI
ncbi:MAG: hypothetical protein JXA30_13535 [Deltaproteobacteria bacterium]|nr:hypothetical protein [Deltaproteobacteria bacterium]